MGRGEDDAGVDLETVTVIIEETVDVKPCGDAVVAGVGTMGLEASWADV